MSLTANKMPLVPLFGPQYPRMFQDAVGSVGNYLEVYHRNLDPILPLGGRNQIASLDYQTPQHYVPPGFSRK